MNKKKKKRIIYKANKVAVHCKEGRGVALEIINNREPKSSDVIDLKIIILFIH